VIGGPDARPARRLRRLLSAVVAILALGAGLGVALVIRHPAGHSGGARTGQAPAPAGSLGGSWQPSSVDLSGLRWSDWHGVDLPSSPAAGPRDTSGGLASGFADTPLGALVAALNIGVRANYQWGPGIFGPTILDQVTGPDAAALLSGCQSSYDQASQAAGVSGGQPLGNAYVSEEAYRLDSWSPAAATIDLVSAGPGDDGVTVHATTRIGLVWSGGDWRVVAPPGGNWAASAGQLSSLSGYTVFPGQG
jgi:hypothetical protein